MKAAVECQLDRSLSRHERTRRIDKVWDKICYWQRRNREAARLHRKKRLQALRHVGIDLRKAKRCPRRI